VADSFDEYFRPITLEKPRVRGDFRIIGDHGIRFILNWRRFAC
jgi:hypothetical protein